MAKNKENTTTELVEEFTEVKPGESNNLTADDLINNNKKTLSIALAVVVGVVALFFGWKLYKDDQNEEASKLIYFPEYYYGIDSFNVALKGGMASTDDALPGGKFIGFEEIAETYSGTTTGNLAAFYTGHCYMKLGKFNEAIPYLEKYDNGDKLVQARAYALIGDAYTELGDNDKAINYYDKAANWEPNQYFTPVYLIKLALSYEATQQYDKASAAMDVILKDYANAYQYVNQAKKYKAKFDQLATTK